MVKENFSTELKVSEVFPLSPHHLCVDYLHVMVILQEQYKASDYTFKLVAGGFSKKCSSMRQKWIFDVYSQTWPESIIVVSFSVYLL